MPVHLRPGAVAPPDGTLTTIDGTLRFEPGSPSLPDFLLFLTTQPWPDSIAIAGESASQFRLLQRTGGLDVYPLRTDVRRQAPKNR